MVDAVEVAIVDGASRPSDHATGIWALSEIDDLLEIGRQGFVARAVHHHELRTVVEAGHALGELGVELRQFVELGRGHRVPRNDRATFSKLDIPSIPKLANSLIAL